VFNKFRSTGNRFEKPVLTGKINSDVKTSTTAQPTFESNTVTPTLVEVERKHFTSSKINDGKDAHFVEINQSQDVN
jgi:hypothetical protein